MASCSPTQHRPAGPACSSWRSWFLPSSWVDGRGGIRPGRGLRLWLLLLGVMLTVVPPMLMPRVTHSPPLLSTFTSARAQTPRMSLVSLQLCDSQQATTTDPSSTTTTVGVPCEPTDVVANQSEYLGMVISSLLLFGVFFLIGFKVWT
jgi:hypothetical protein